MPVCLRYCLSISCLPSFPPAPCRGDLSAFQLSEEELEREQLMAALPPEVRPKVEALQEIQVSGNTARARPCLGV